MIFVVWDVWKVTGNEPIDPLIGGKLREEQVDDRKVYMCILCDHLVMR